MDRHGIEDAILAQVGKDGAGVTEAVDAVLPTVDQDDDTWAWMNRLGWISHAHTLISEGRTEKKDRTGSTSSMSGKKVRAVSRTRTRSGKKTRVRSTLERVEYQGADGRMRPLIAFTLADWVKFRSREVSVIATSEAKIALADRAIEALSRSKAKTTGALPADLLASVTQAAEALYGSPKEQAA